MLIWVDRPCRSTGACFFSSCFLCCQLEYSGYVYSKYSWLRRMYMLWSWVHVQYVHVHYIYTSTVHESSIEDLDQHYCTTYQVPPMHPSELCTTPSMHYDYCLTSCTMYLLYIGRNCNSSSGFGHDDNIPLEVWLHVPRGWVWVWIWIWAYVGTCTYADCTEYMMGYSTCLAT